MPALDISKTLVELTIDLCNIESVSSNEKYLADEVEKILSAAPHLSVVRDGNALVASTNLDRESRVLIAGHLDTVPVLICYVCWSVHVTFLFSLCYPFQVQSMFRLFVSVRVVY